MTEKSSNLCYTRCGVCSRLISHEFGKKFRGQRTKGDCIFFCDKCGVHVPHIPHQYDEFKPVGLEIASAERRCSRCRQVVSQCTCRPTNTTTCNVPINPTNPSSCHGCTPPIDDNSQCHGCEDVDSCCNTHGIIECCIPNSGCDPDIICYNGRDGLQGPQGPAGPTGPIGPAGTGTYSIHFAANDLSSGLGFFVGIGSDPSNFNRVAIVSDRGILISSITLSVKQTILTDQAATAILVRRSLIMGSYGPVQNELLTVNVDDATGSSNTVTTMPIQINQGDLIAVFYQSTNIPSANISVTITGVNI